MNAVIQHTYSDSFFIRDKECEYAGIVCNGCGRSSCLISPSLPSRGGGNMSQLSYRLCTGLSCKSQINNTCQELLCTGCKYRASIKGGFTDPFGETNFLKVGSTAKSFLDDMTTILQEAAKTDDSSVTGSYRFSHKENFDLDKRDLGPLLQNGQMLRAPVISAMVNILNDHVAEYNILATKNKKPLKKVPMNSVFFVNFFA